MQIFVTKDGQQNGPFSIDEIKVQLAAGSLTFADYGWYEGLAKWQTLGTLAPFAANNTSAVAGPPKAQPRERRRSSPANGSRKASKLAITSMVFGICSYVLCLSILTGIPAIICGHVALGKIKRPKARLSGRGMAIAGLVMGYISLGFMLPSIHMILRLSVPTINQAVIVTKQSQSVAHAKQISLACVEYANRHDGKYPDSLDELNLPNKKILTSPLAVDGTEQSYVYISGLTTSSPGDTIFLYDKNVSNGFSSRLKKHVVARIDGVCKAISDVDFEKEIKPSAP
jgi:hypothetical protein